MATALHRWQSDVNNCRVIQTSIGEIQAIHGTYRGQSRLLFLSLFPVSRPQTTLKFMDIKGKTFEHVTQVGKGFPSGPLGTSVNFGFSFTASGRVRATRASTSSLLPIRSSFPTPLNCFAVELPRLGEGDAFPFPLAFSESCSWHTERVSRPGISTLPLRDDPIKRVLASLAFRERMEMTDRKEVA